MKAKMVAEELQKFERGVGTKKSLSLGDERFKYPPSSIYFEKGVTSGWTHKISMKIPEYQQRLRTVLSGDKFLIDMIYEFLEEPETKLEIAKRLQENEVS